MAHLDNRVSLRLRSSETIEYEYDALNREILKDIPGGTSADVYSRYDLAGRRTLARFSSTVTPSSDCSANNAGIDYCYDAVGRLLYETSYGRRLAFQYDAASNRTRITHPDSTYRVDQVQLNGSASGANLIADYAYDAMSRRTGLARGNGVTTAYDYTQASRLAELAHDMAGASHDATWSFGYTDAGQLSSRTLVDMYEWPVSALDEDYVANGLNQYTTVDAAAFNYDSRGNLVSDGSRNFTYDYENRLLTATGSVSGTLAYDPLGRLQSYTTNSVTTEFLYDGDRLVAEYVSGAVVRRYAHGPGVDEPLVWYEGAGTTDPRWFVTDRQGSIVAATNASGAAIQTYTYGPYGEPNAWSGARFRYTGQAVLAELQLYHYKARVYDPLLGRFLQTDPVGYADDLNLYAYVGNNPLNASDPTGLFCLIANSFCRRKERYEARARDPRLRDITVFAAAAATTLDTLDTPAFLTGFSPETTAFLEGVSAKLEVENGRIFNALIAGNSIPGITDAPDGIDRGIVRYEQGLVQGELDALRANDTDLYNTVVSEVNDAFAAWGGTSNAISAASRNLGHTPDFANRRDREQIGYETVRTEAAFSCARGDACNAGSLTGP